MDDYLLSRIAAACMSPIKAIKKSGRNDRNMNGLSMSADASGSGMSGIVSHGGDHTTDKNNHNRNGRGFLR